MKRKNFFLFFLLPFFGITVIFLVFSSLNRAYIQKKIESLVQEQLQATAEILRVNITHFMEENFPLDDILKRYASEDNIYYMALLDEGKNILGWSSRFEGYLPLSLQDTERKEPWVISSPVGKIFNSLTPFMDKNGKSYSLYLGYSLGSLEEMITRSNQNFIVIFGFIAAAGVVFYVGISRLQTRFLEKKDELEKERREKERFKEVSAFTSGVAHEIKNPLNSLALLFELLQKKVSPEFGEELALGQSEVVKISRIVDEFSDTLRPLQLKREICRLDEIFESARDALSKELSKPDVELTYRENAPVELFADKNLLARSFLNLLRNALEATEAGTVAVNVAKHRKNIFIRIKDTGKGIPPEDLSRVFDPFFTTKRTGMGIGLYLARKIIKAHGGEIEVHSAPERGTVFSILLPGGQHE